MSESPNDVGKMHMLLKQQFQSSALRYDKDNEDTSEFAEPLGQVWGELKELLDSYMDKQSFSTIWRCLKHSKNFINKAFQHANVASA